MFHLFELSEKREYVWVLVWKYYEVSQNLEEITIAQNFTEKAGDCSDPPLHPLTIQQWFPLIRIKWQFNPLNPCSTYCMKLLIAMSSLRSAKTFSNSRMVLHFQTTYVELRKFQIHRLSHSCSLSFPFFFAIKKSVTLKVCFKMKATQ